MLNTEKLDLFVGLFNAIPESPEKEKAKYLLGVIINDGILESVRATPTTVNVEVEKNTKGFNYKAVVVGAERVERALEMLGQAQSGLMADYGGDEVQALRLKIRELAGNLVFIVNDDAPSEARKEAISTIFKKILDLVE